MNDPVSHRFQKHFKYACDTAYITACKSIHLRFGDTSKEMIN